MGFLAPLSILWLIPLGGLVVLLYLLKLKRKERVVSSVFLWRQAIQDVQANAPFQKLRKNTLLFIQLGVLLLAIASLARPFARTVGLTGQNIVLVMDSSASMKATDIGKSRFDEAKKLALSTVDRMGRGDSMLIITAGVKTRVTSAFTSDKKSLAASIDQLEPHDTRANLREAMILALSLVAKKKNPQIVVLSDGGFGPIGDISPGNAKINFIRVGKRADNVGIVALDARRTLSGTQQVFIGLQSFADKKRDFNMEVYLNDQLYDIREESLQKGETKQEILAGLPEVGGRITVKLDIKDDLAADNIGNTYLTKPKKLSVLLVTNGNLFLERAFSLNPRTDVVKATEAPADVSKFDIAVFDGIEPPDNLPNGGYLLINTDCKQAPAKLSKTIANPSIADWSKKNPITAYIDFETVRMEKAQALSISNWGQGLIDCEGGTIAASGEDSGKRFVVLGWDLLKSDFPLRVGFPIFVTNCIEWLGGTDGEANCIIAKTGDLVPIEAPGIGKIDIISPNDDAVDLAVNNGSAVFDGTEQAGVYKIKSKGKMREFACNLLSTEESNTSPRGKIEIGDKKVASSGGGIRTNREFWRIFLLACLALITFEWFAFHRRVA